MSAQPTDRDGQLVVPPVQPVVFIPGIKGSVLKRPDCRGQLLWGDTRVVWLSNLDDLAVPLPGSPRSGLERRIQPCGILGVFEARLFFPLLTRIEIPFYSVLRTILEEAGKLEENKILFYLPYDWRLDNRIAAVELAARLTEFRETYEQKYLRDDYCKSWRPEADLDACLAEIGRFWREILTPDGRHVRFNILTHSMGGLIARYLVRALGHGHDVDRLVLIASPNQGTAEALEAVVSGEFPLLGPLLHFFDKKQARPVGLSFPAMFQILPRYRHAVRPDEHRPGFLQSELGLDETWDQVSENDIPGRWLELLGWHDRTDTSWNLVCRVSGMEDDWTQCTEKVRKHIGAALRSAFMLHRIIDQRWSQLPPEEQAEERRNIEEAIKVVNSPERAWRVGRRVEMREVLLEGERRHEEAVRVHQLFGHCHRTSTEARTLQEGERLRIHFCDPDVAGGNGACDFGDHRVARRSFDDLRRRMAPERLSDVVLCVDHTSVIKDRVVQDNILRILMGPRIDAPQTSEAPGTPR